MFKTQLSTQDLAQADRFRERYEDPLPKADYSTGEGFIRIGDEFFSVAELEAEAVKHPQPRSHPIKPNHFCLQNELDKINEYYKRFPERKMVK